MVISLVRCLKRYPWLRIPCTLKPLYYDRQVSFIMMAKSHKLVYIFGAWMFSVLALLVLFQSLNFEYFFVLCLIGFLIIVELSGPFTVRPEWRKRVNIVILIGVLIFGLIALTKVINILGIKLF